MTVRSSSRKGRIATTQQIMDVMVRFPRNEFDRVRVQVSYNKGGWDGAPRGFSIMAFPAKKGEAGTTTIGLFTGASIFVEEATRFSYPRLFKLCDRVRDGELKSDVNLVLTNVMMRNDMAILDERIYLYRPDA